MKSAVSIAFTAARFPRATAKSVACIGAACIVGGLVLVLTSSGGGERRAGERRAGGLALRPDGIAF